MKNKKIFLLSLTLILSASMAFGQVALRFGTGYYAGAFKTTSMEAKVYNDVTMGGQTIPGENIYYSFGGGLPILIGLDIPIADNFFFNADFNYWLGSNTTVGEVDISAETPFGTVTNMGTIVTKSNQIRFNPGLTFMNDMGLYSRIGLVIPLGGKTTVTSDFEGTGPSGPTFMKKVTETTGKFSIGAQTAVGFKTEISKTLSFFAEIQAIALNIQSATSEITEYEDNSGTKLEEKYPTTYERETEFVDELNSSSNNEDYNDDYKEGSPKEAFASKSPFGAFGLSVGVTWTLGK